MAILFGTLRKWNGVFPICHCYRENDTIIRIISARKANKLEQKQYQEFL
ncbi:hypothetical protein NIES3585_42950 [Nodularia sp. NIES-3585]|nr:hypothetical protein NIES3585_42950 [Nodularia sp. NIES-3585]